MEPSAKLKSETRMRSTVRENISTWSRTKKLCQYSERWVRSRLFNRYQVNFTIKKCASCDNFGV